jgi:hypothetical protein
MSTEDIVACCAGGLDFLDRLGNISTVYIGGGLGLIIVIVIIVLLVRR